MAKKKRKDKSDDFIKIEEKTKKVEKNETKYEEVKKKDITTKEEKMVTKPEVTKNKTFKHPFVHGFLVFVLFTSLAYFIVSLFYNDTDSIATLISSLLLIVFTLLFVAVSIGTNRKNKNGFFLSGLVLLGYFVFSSLITIGIISFPNNKVIDFTNMSLTEVIKWSEKNNVNIVQDYEYSDMISEYYIISQDVEVGTKIKDVDSITVAVSEGPNPSKEIVIPNMVSWDSERVLEFIKNNYLTNVEVEFVKSSKQPNTVIEQNKSGNMKRDEELKLVFSYGEEIGYDEVKLKDLAGMSKFEAIFYLKQYHLKYEFEEVFSSKVKRGFVVKQNVKPGTMIKINDEKIVVSISKGPEINVPNLKRMSMSEITEWVVKNKLKLEFTDKYDDSIDENSVISANYKEGEVVAEGTVIKVVISRGKLLMQKFNSYDDFRDWAAKYEVNYEEQHQFSNDIVAGEVISYSYKTGEAIKNNDSIIVIISDGKEASVPNVVGSTKEQATTKLKNAGFGYSFVYSYSSSVAKGNVIKQSISAGAKVAQGTTITVTISNGPKPASSSASGSGSSSSGGGSSGGSSSGGSSTPTTPTCDKSTQVWLYEELYDTTNPANTCAKIKARYPNVKFNCTYTSGPTKGLVSNSASVDGKTYTNCDNVTLVIWN